MDGIILINKQKDYTSHDVVAIVKKLLGEKVGHTGTLDPNATGILPLLIGKGTKISKYLIDHNKKYKATLKLGIKTDTLDIVGNILESREVVIDKNIKIEEVLKSFIGKQKQYPPMYSAIKINGKKLYQYAREGKQVDIQPRTIEIYDIELNSYNEIEKEIIFTVLCSKGTYIRTLCENIAERLGTIGCMKELEREQVGRFKLQDSITVQELKDVVGSKDFVEKYLIKFEEIFKSNAEIILNNKEVELFLNGVKLNYGIEDNVYRIYNNENKFIGIGVVNNGLLKRDVIL